MDVRRFLHLIYEQAIACGYCETNIINGTKLKKVGGGVLDRDNEVYNEEEIKLLLDALQSDQDFLTLITIALETGARRGEYVALQYSDFNKETGEITIQRNAVVDEYGNTVICDPKMMTSKRTIPLSAFCQKLINDSYKRYLRDKLRLGNEFADSGCILHTPDGRMFAAHSLTTKWNRFLGANGLKHIKFHGLRKTAATLQLKGGMDPKTVSNRLGHTDCSLTLKIYTAVTSEMKKAGADKMDLFYKDVVNQ